MYVHQLVNLAVQYSQQLPLQTEASFLSQLPRFLDLRGVAIDCFLQLVDSLFALIKVDASHGAILAGDLLTSSPTPGHAMATLAPAPGTIVGKALEPLESGTGVIRVLVMAR